LHKESHPFSPASFIDEIPSHTHTKDGEGGIKFDRTKDLEITPPPSCLSLIQYFVCVVERAFRNSGWNREPWEKNEFLAFLHTRKQHILMMMVVVVVAVCV
jgi:hypothetical protein